MLGHLQEIAETPVGPNLTVSARTQRKMNFVHLATAFEQSLHNEEAWSSLLLTSVNTTFGMPKETRCMKGMHMHNTYIYRGQAQ
jgi:hypothetical protein